MSKTKDREIEKLRKQLAVFQDDLATTALTLAVLTPKPGTDLARVLAANRTLTRERDELRRRLLALELAMKSTGTTATIGVALVIRDETMRGPNGERR